MFYRLLKEIRTCTKILIDSIKKRDKNGAQGHEFWSVPFLFPSGRVRVSRLTEKPDGKQNGWEDKVIWVWDSIMLPTEPRIKHTFSVSLHSSLNRFCILPTVLKSHKHTISISNLPFSAIQEDCSQAVSESRDYCRYKMTIASSLSRWNMLPISLPASFL